MQNTKSVSLTPDDFDEQTGVVSSRLDRSAKTLVKRRHLLRLIAAATGTVAISHLAPGEWVRPVVEWGVLPAHAQISDIPTPTPTLTPPPPPTLISECDTTTGLLHIVMTWNTTTDVDLHTLEVCSLTDVAPVGWGGPTGLTIRHLGDDQGGPGSSEVITQITTGVVLAGIYNVHVGGATGVLPTTVTVTITTDQGSESFQRTLTDANYVGVADIIFPGGKIKETTSFSFDLDHQ